MGDTVQVAGRTITVTELDGRRIARLRVTANSRPTGTAGPGRPAPGRPAPGRPAPGRSGRSAALSTSGNGVSAGQVRLDSEAPHE